MENFEMILGLLGSIVAALSALGYARHKIVQSIKKIKKLISEINLAIDSITRFYNKYKEIIPDDEFKNKIIKPIDKVTETSADLAKIHKCTVIEKRLRDLIS